MTNSDPPVAIRLAANRRQQVRMLLALRVDTLADDLTGVIDIRHGGQGPRRILRNPLVQIVHDAAPPQEHAKGRNNIRGSAGHTYDVTQVVDR